MDIVKDSLVKDGKLIVHIGREDIEGTRFFILTPETAVEVRKLIDEYLGQSGDNIKWMAPEA
ncbi:hypothetical protein CRX22_10495 [Salmonella enterica subsp. enterica serovar Newport]|jgi:hypothetical protein|nr:hypothetical protein [Salmonella enterica subsp. enterica serovar Newport]